MGGLGGDGQPLRDPPRVLARGNPLGGRRKLPRHLGTRRDRDRHALHRLGLNCGHRLGLCGLACTRCGFNIKTLTSRL